MTQTLLINCSLTSKSDELKEALEAFTEAKVIDFKEITADFRIPNYFDAVVVSGSGARIVDSSQRIIFQETAELIKNCKLPLLGICYGHQLLCWAFECKVGSLAEGVFDRFENIRIIGANDLFDGFKKGQRLPLAENHYNYVLKEGLEQAGFTLLADSASCEVEAVKHKAEPFYGVQFHPERITLHGETHPEGHTVIEAFYKFIVKR